MLAGPGVLSSLSAQLCRIQHHASAFCAIMSAGSPLRDPTPWLCGRWWIACAGCTSSARTACTWRRGRVADKSRDIPRSFGFHAGLLQKTEIAEPVDVAELPGAKGYVVAVRQAAAHAA